MATVHCKACGKSYSYEENGCCPSCGAYNRPPRRETVEADGTVHHLDDRAASTGRMRAAVGRSASRKRSATRSRRAAAECGAHPKSRGGKPAASRCLRSW